MQNMRSIEIDFEVNKQIEIGRLNFDETPNDVLRRLLGIEKPKAAQTISSFGEKAWSGKGVILPHGTELRMDYNGRTYEGLIDNGKWIAEGKEFGSPSAAASGIALTKGGKLTNLDGWIYWYVRLPNQKNWKAIKSLKPKISKDAEKLLAELGL